MGTTIISLYGGPGTGKSTSAAYLYYLLKTQGCNAELVREYVKDWAWEGRGFTTYDQLYFLGKQTRRESMLYGKVDWIVTDSPVLLNAYYAERHCPELVSDGVRAAVKSFYDHAAADGHRHVHVFLRRSKPYVAAGRYQTESEARDIDAEMLAMLEASGMEYFECETSEAELQKLLATLT